MSDVGAMVFVPPVPFAPKPAESGPGLRLRMLREGQAGSMR